MIKVELKACTDVDPIVLASHAALMCYQSEVPEWGKTIDVEGRLFNTGHHTTFQHFFVTFCIDGIAVGDITFGLHLASPFYDSDQRSGRFCAKMFLEPDYGKIEDYIAFFWPQVDVPIRRGIMDYVKEGVGLYHESIGVATEVAEKFIREERPFATEKYLKQNAPKIAQEQLRMCIPVIFPTGFDFTVNLSVLAAMYRAAWTPPMRFTLQKMVDLVVAKYPNIAFMFEKDALGQDDWGVDFFSGQKSRSRLLMVEKPKLLQFEINKTEDFVAPIPEIRHPVDQLFFRPETMNNSVGSIFTEIAISLATMGQDQRHRTISRGQPCFTGDFYFPPILTHSIEAYRVFHLMGSWITLYSEIPKSLASIIAPYGAMVRYKKRGSLNAVTHEQTKRLCWCAQEEIYHLARALRLAVEKEREDSPLLRLFEPPCFKTGQCAEGARYCGRDISWRDKGDYFPLRRV